jgi:transcription factor MBP1
VSDNKLGTWVPLQEGRALAEKNQILSRLNKIFDYVAGERSPPPAPKHATAASSRPKVPKASQPRKPASQGMTVPKVPKRLPTQHAAGYYRPSQEQYDNVSAQLHDDETPDDVTPESASFLGDDDMLPMSQTSTGSRKRKRGTDNVGYSTTDLDHINYGDELLDYFVTSAEDPNVGQMYPPIAPPSFPIDKAIDNHGNNSLHWACSMGDVHFARDLINRGANVMLQNELSGETPLIRAVLFTNNYDKHTFPKIVNLLSSTVLERDWHGANVFHHIAETARSKTRWSCARYYCEVLVNKSLESGPHYIQAALTASDQNQDTPVLCAVRHGCTKVAMFLLNHCPEAGDMPNLHGQTANDLLRNMSHQQQSQEQAPSSPIKPGDSFGRRRSKNAHKSGVSRAASNVLLKVGPIMEDAGERLAEMYDAEMKEKDMSIAEAKQALADLEEQKHKIRQEYFALMAKSEDDSNLNAMRGQYETLLRENESLLEQKDHATLQREVRSHDQQSPSQAFRSANPRPLTQEEIRAALPWAKELNRQQMRRRDNVRNIARLMSEAGTSEKIGKHRKLVSIATGLKEEELDSMSVELLESLETGQVGVGEGPRTPARIGLVLG